MRYGVSIMIGVLVLLANGLSAQPRAIVDSLTKVYQETQLRPTEKLEVLLGLARGYASLRDTAQLMDYTSQAIALATKQDDPASLAKAYYYLGLGIARTNVASPKALEHVATSLELATKAKDHRQEARSADILSALYDRNNDFANNLNYRLLALEAWKKANDTTEIVSECLLIGNIYTNKGLLDQALAYYFEALELSEARNDINQMTSLYNNIGVVLKKKNEYEKALIFYEKLLSLAKKENLQHLIPGTYNNIGNVYLNNDENKKALEYYEKALRKFEKLKDTSGISLSYNNFGEVYQKLEKTETALDFLKKAYELRKNLNEPSQLGHTAMMIGAIYADQQAYPKAERYYREALSIAQEKSLNSLERDVHRRMYLIFRDQNRYQEALDAHVRYQALEDSLFDQQSASKAAQLEAQYNVKQTIESIQRENNDKLERDKLAIQYQKQLVTTFGIALLILLLIAAYAGYLNLQKSKLNKQLTNQSKELVSQKEELLQQRANLEQTNLQLEKTQNELISKQAQIEGQNQELSIQKQQTTDSIKSAAAIQAAFLPKNDKFLQLFPNSFIINRPRDIVSGDFYWANEIDQHQIIIVGDCIGHGVPGAFRSLVTINLLDRTILQEGQTKPSKINQKLDDGLKQSIYGSERIDIGVDMAVVRLTPQTDGRVQVCFSGAKSAMLVFSNQTQTLEEFKGTRRSLGAFAQRNTLMEFTDTELMLEAQDRIYLASDGFMDQNNAQRRKMGKRYFHQLIGQSVQLPVSEQGTALEQALDAYMQNTTQRDDIICIGIEV